jgi:hypothetical protein
MSRAMLYRSLNALVSGGLLRNESTGQRAFYRLTGEPS